MSAQPDTIAAASADLPVFATPQAWYGQDLAARTDWLHRFTPAEIAELDRAVAQAEASGREIIDLRREDFPLPTLSARLAAVRSEVLKGRGFHLFRGVPVDRYTLRQSAIAYWGLGLYLGDEPVSQNGKGHVLGHVTNLGLDYADPEVRGYQTSARLAYHSDSSDIVALLCLRTARSGGLSSLVSTTTIWNEMVRSHPQHLRTLMQPLYYTRWGEIPANRKPWAEMPAFTPWQGQLISGYVRSAINKSQLMPEVPRLSAEQLEAMAVLESLCADPRLHLDMALEPGDVQIVCNHFILHSRTAYEDFPEPERRRHLLRLWLACSDGPALPPHVTENQQGVSASGRPDGIRVPGVPFVAPLTAE